MGFHCWLVDEPQGNKPCYVKLRWRALPEHMLLDARGTKFPAEIVYYNSLDNISIDNINFLNKKIK